MSKEKGFLLLGELCFFAISALLIASLLQAYTSCIGWHRQVELRRQALQAAERALAGAAPEDRLFCSLREQALPLVDGLPSLVAVEAAVTEQDGNRKVVDSVFILKRRL